MAGASADRNEVDHLISQCDAVIPDTKDFDTSSFFAALDAGTAVVGTFRSLLDADTKHIVEVVTYCGDTVHTYIQERDDLHYQDPQFDMKIAQDPLVKRELARQSEIL